MVCPDVPLFSALSHKPHGYRGENILEYRLCFNFLYRICLKYLSFCEEFSESRSQMYIGFYVIHPLLISDLNENLNFCRLFDNIQVSRLMKIRPVELR